MNDLTSEEMAPLRVPLAALPGLDPVGLRLVRIDNGWTSVCVGTCFQRQLVMHNYFDSKPIVEWDVDLADASTRDRIARWAAERVGLEVGSTAPSWGWCPPVMTWRLYAEHGEWDAPRSLFDDAFWDRHLGNLRPLPDGALYVTALALAMAAAHLGAK